MSKIEQLRDAGNDVREGLVESNDTGREIANAKRMSSEIIERVNVPEESDMAAIRAAANAVRDDARSDFQSRVTERINEAGTRSEGLQQEAREGSDQSRLGAQQMEQARDASPYGASGIASAIEGLGNSEQEFRRIQEQLRNELEQARQQAQSTLSEI